MAVNKNVKLHAELSPESLEKVQRFIDAMKSAGVELEKAAENAKAAAAELNRAAEKAKAAARQTPTRKW